MKVIQDRDAKVAPLKVGIIANEFFDATINRVGGFGWAGRRAIEALRSAPDFDRPVYFSGDFLSGRTDLSVDGVRIIIPRRSRLIVPNMLAALDQKVDILLTIDFRPSYLTWFKAMPRTPVVVWVRDPRTREDMARIDTLRIPGTEARPGGVPDFDFRALARYKRRTRWLGRDIILANKMAYMRDKIPGTFGLPPSHVVLPNPDVVDYSAIHVRKSERPIVVSLARLDPVKRPWLFIELARRFPEVDFVMLGKGFVSGKGGWQPTDVPENVRMMGNVTGQEKLDVLSAAWVLVNTAIHEESAVSMMEALAYETPIISFIESDGLSERFGTCLGYDTGTGLQSLPRLEDALRGMLNDDDRRRSLGRKGREWVMEEHNTENFLSSFRRIAESCGVR